MENDYQIPEETTIQETERLNTLHRPGPEASKLIKNLRNLKLEETFAHNSKDASLLIPCTAPKKSITQISQQQNNIPKNYPLKISKRVAIIKLDDPLICENQSKSIHNKTAPINFSTYLHNYSLSINLPNFSAINTTYPKTPPISKISKFGIFLI